MYSRAGSALAVRLPVGRPAFPNWPAVAANRPNRRERSPTSERRRRLRYLGFTTIDENPSRVSCTAAGAASYFTYYNDFVAFISAQQQRLAIKHAGECLSQRAPLSVIATRCIN